MRRAWLLVGGVFSLVSVVGLGSAFGFGMDLPEDSADTALISSRSTETTVSVYRIATTELFVDMKGEVDVKVVPVAGVRGGSRSSDGSRGATADATTPSRGTASGSGRRSAAQRRTAAGSTR
ncbi:hypothetical protein [Nonomuraea africana]|uniref:hypothetical protein n=1 Tax=Nonomuraea africana TaxID=46171 RepID=UPI00340AFD95